MEKEIFFTFEKETKNTIRFKEEIEEGLERGYVGTIYVLKDAFEEGKKPKKIKVTIEVLED